MSVKRYEPVERPGPGRWACIKLVESPVGSCVLASDYDALAARVAELERVVSVLCAGIKRWAADEDGVPDYLWHTYLESASLIDSCHKPAAGLTPAPSEPPAI
jgi:hypothetical protein